MTKNELAKRHLLFIVSLFFSALGVAVTRHGALGVSPISSVANVLSYRFPEISMGTWLIIWNCFLVIVQIAILRKNFQPIQLLQVPLSFLFGYFTDFGTWCIASIPADIYPVRMLFVISGVVILGFGIALSVIANVIMNAGEAVVKTISDCLHKNFGNVKIVFDISNVALSVLLSLIFFNGTIVGAREGTVIAAVCTGMVVKFFTKILKNPLNRILRGF